MFDAVVVGAGPAGALCARQLALGGASVLLVDKAAFPREKVCGCCINPAALDELNAAGLDDLATQCEAVPLHALRLCSGGAAATVALRGGVSLSRARLDAALVEAAVRAGAVFTERTCARLAGARPCGSRLSGRGVRLSGPGGVRDVAAKVVIVCSGLGGRLLEDEPGFAVRVRPASRMGVAAIIGDAGGASCALEPGVVQMACGGRRGYVGMVRLEGGGLNVAAALDPAFVKRSGGPGAAVSSLLRDAGGECVGELEAADWQGAPRLTRRLNRVAGHRLMVVGDAAGYVEPFTGEGIAWALRSAAAAAPIAADAIEQWSAAHADRWTQAHRGAVGRRQRRCRAVAAVLRSSAATNAAVRALRRAPGIARPFVRAIHGCDGRIKGTRDADASPVGNERRAVRSGPSLSDSLGTGVEAR